MNAAPTKERQLEIGKVNFDSMVLRSQRPVLVLFWAPWSTACRVAEPVLNEVMREISGGVSIVRINADENPHISLWYGIQSLPTLLYFVNGDVHSRIVGTASKEVVLTKLGYANGNPCPPTISGVSNEHK